MSTTSRPSSAYTLPYGALRFTNMNLRTLGSLVAAGCAAGAPLARWRSIASVTEHHQSIRADRRFHELSQAGNAEALREVFLDDAAAQRRGHAHDEVQAVLLAQLDPALHDVAVVLRRLREPGRVVHAVVIEEHPVDLVARFERRLAEQVRAVA